MGSLLSAVTNGRVTLLPLLFKSQLPSTTSTSGNFTRRLRSCGQVGGIDKSSKTFGDTFSSLKKRTCRRRFPSYARVFLPSFSRHLRECSPACVICSVSWQHRLTSCCFLSLLCLSPVVSLPLISHSCPVVRHLGFALSSAAPSRCFILITPYACHSPLNIFSPPSPASLF